MKRFSVWASGAGLALTGLGVAAFLVTKTLLGGIPPTGPGPEPAREATRL
ncbi:hypothetical protein ACFYW6_13960 [Streptomyces sp. NPDC002659]